MLTGESEPIACTTHPTDSNFLETANLVLLGILHKLIAKAIVSEKSMINTESCFFSFNTGSNVVEGRGRGVVVATGNRTTMGKITVLASAEQVQFFLGLILVLILIFVTRGPLSFKNKSHILF